MEIFVLLLVLTIGTWYSVRIYFRRTTPKHQNMGLNPLGINKDDFLYGIAKLHIRHPHASMITQALQQTIYGGEGYSTMLVAALLAQGHVIIQGPPGTGKTLLVKVFSQVCDLRYGRIQCTPDLLPQDILGSEILDTHTNTFAHNPGPIFANVVHVDEINRTTPKLQSAFLEAMQEGQTTMFGKTYTLPRPFFLVATQNPFDAMGTYLLPYAQVDRFMIGITTSHLSAEKELELMRNNELTKKNNDNKITPEQILSMIHDVENISVSDDILEYVVTCMQYLKNAGFSISVRASKSLLGFAKALAYLQGATIVTKHDIIVALLPVITHRVDYIVGMSIAPEKLYDIMIGSLQKDDIVA